MFFLIFNLIVVGLNIFLVCKCLKQQIFRRITVFICVKCNGGEKKEALNNSQGQILFDSLISKFSLKFTQPSVEFVKYRRAFSFHIRWNLRLSFIPIKCLSACNYANSMAISATDKYTYQFGCLNYNDVDDIFDFITQYIASKDGFSKKNDRPTSLKETVLARIPPF